MPPSVQDRLQNILASIREIESIVHGANLEQFTMNLHMRLLTERFLEIVCEAARRLPDSTKLDEPDIDWRGMVNFANRLRHAYHATDPKVVWETIQEHLPPLKSFAERRIAESGK